MASLPWQDRTLRRLIVLLFLCVAVALIASAFVSPPPTREATAPVQPLPSGSDEICSSCLSADNAEPCTAGSGPVNVKILAVNDFHGQIAVGQTTNKRPVGSAPVLASYLKSATDVFGPANTFLVFPGDVIGASPPQSGLLYDEPSLLFFNEFANPCSTGENGPAESGCNLVMTPGNHEFDRGTGELLRQVYGGNGNASITHLANPYPGTRSSYTCSNVVWRENGTTIFPPYVIRNISGVPIAFIGADTITTPERLAPHRADDILFLNETELLTLNEQAVAPVIGRLIAVVSHDITRDENAAGESALGDLLADSQRSVMETDVAFITTGTMRSDIKAGNVTWGDLFSVQPFSGTVVSVKLTGQQIRAALEQQWQEPLPPHTLGVSGLTYTYDAAQPAGSRVQDVLVGSVPLDPMRTYTAAMMDYLSIGGDGYTIFTNGTFITSGPSDVNTFASYLGSLPMPVNATADGRIRKIP